ncbi:MAG: hypothetical protein JOZ52_08755, partial [Acidobacteria bacterium]|nr:hypothetical protein [Acidobacteriota bacterium]
MKRMLFAALLTLAALATAQAQTAKPPSLPLQKSDGQTQADKLAARRRAVKAEMRKAQDAYDEDKFEEAVAHARKASDLDPTNKDVLLFIGRTIERQYRHIEDAAEKANKAREAIIVYQRVVLEDPNNDEAFEAVTSLYSDLKEKELARSWLMQRAINSLVSVANRADAYLMLSLMEKDCASDVVERVTDKLYVAETNETDPARIDAETAAELDRGQQCASRGLQMVEAAIALTPESDFAWARKVELLSHTARLYELAGDDARGEQYRAQAEEGSGRQQEFEAKRKEAALANAVTVDCGALCAKVIETPRPAYPAIAKTAHATGAVVV